MSKVFNNVYLKLKREYENSLIEEYNSKNLLKDISTTLDNLYKNLLNIELILKEITLFDTSSSEEFLNLSYGTIGEIHKSFPKLFFENNIEENEPETYLDAIEELKWHKQENIWDCSKKIYDAKGKIFLELSNFEESTE